MKVQDHEMSELLSELSAWSDKAVLANADEGFKEPNNEWFYLDRLLAATQSIHQAMAAESRCEGGCGPKWHKTQVAMELFTAASFLMAATASQLLANDIDQSVFWKIVGRDHVDTPESSQEMVEALRMLGFNVMSVELCIGCEGLVVDGTCTACGAEQ